MKIDRRSFVSPNFSSRKGKEIDTVVIHHTGGRYSGDINWLCSEESQVSCHYYIKRDGRVFQLVDEANNAWHAGKSYYDVNGDGKITRDEMWFNRRSLGIELESTGGNGYTHLQLDSLVRLCRDINDRIPVSFLGIKKLPRKEK